LLCIRKLCKIVAKFQFPPQKKKKEKKGERMMEMPKGETS